MSASARSAEPPDLLLAPGSSGGSERLAPYIAGLNRLGVAADAVDLPRGRVEAALVRYRAAFAEKAGAHTAIGGHSFGGRVASLLAAEADVRALVLLAYPLHAPGRPEAWDERTSHWPGIRCPVLLLSGEADPFAQLPLLRRAVERLAEGELVTFPGVRHGVGPVLDAALERVASFLAAARR